MAAFAQLYSAALKEFLRTRMSLFWALAFPVMFILLFGVIFTNTGSSKFDVGLVDEDGGASQLVSAIRKTPVFKLSEGTRDAELASLKKGDLRGVILLPSGLSEAIARKQTASVEVYTDPSQLQTAQIILSVVQQTLEDTERRLNNSPQLFKIESKSIQVESVRFIDLFVANMLALALMQLGLFATAQPVVQLREQGVLRRFSATPLPRLTLVASQVAMRITIALVQAVVIIGIGWLLFKVAIVGDWLVLLGLVVLGALMFVTLGYVIAAFSKNQESAAGISSVLNFPMMFLSGLFFPVELIPDFLKPVVAVVPLTYLADALRQVMVGGSPLHPIALDATIIGAWCVASTVVAVRFFKWE